MSWLDNVRVFLFEKKDVKIRDEAEKKHMKELQDLPLDFEPKLKTRQIVLHKSENIFIYLNPFNELGWELKNIPKHARNALQEFILINSLMNLYLNRSQKKDLSKLLASRLYYCLTATEPYNTDMIFKEAREFVESRKRSIKRRVIETPQFAVYLNDKNNVDWWYHEGIPQYMVDSIEEFEALRELATSTLPKSYKSVFMSKLASSLANSFNKTNAESAKNCFKEARKFIQLKAESFLKLKLFLIGTIFSLLTLMVVITCCYYLIEFRVYFMGIGAGVIGAMVSSLQRNNSISLDSYPGEYGLYCESLSRLIIGAVFGCFIVFGTKSEMFLAPFKENIQAIICFCFISGFVERFVPELINGVVKKNE